MKVGLVLARMLEENRQLDEAREVLEWNMPLLQEHHADHWRTFDALSQYGGVLLELDRTEDGSVTLRRGHEGLWQRKDAIPDSERTAVMKRDLQRLSRLATLEGKPDESQKWSEEVQKWDASQEKEDR